MWKVVRQGRKVRVKTFSRKWLGPMAYDSVLVFPQRWRESPTLRRWTWSVEGGA